MFSTSVVPRILLQRAGGAGMAFREVGVIEVVEMLRLWLLGHGYRAIARMLSMDRKTVRRYVEAAQRRGLSRPGAEGQPSEELIASVVSAVRPSGPGMFGEAWGVCSANRERLREWLEKDLRLTKINELLTRQTGQAVPYRTLHRFCVEELCFGKRRVTVRVDDGKPGEELQVDFGRMGRMRDEKTNLERVVWALILTASYSRHQFVFLTFTQRLSDVIEGFERAWEFFGGVFRVVIPDNLKAVVTKAGALAPRINETFLEYAQARGFVIDPARVRHPRDKARVENTVAYVREDYFAGEQFLDLDDARRGAIRWCQEIAGMKPHRTTQRRPAEHFALVEKTCLLPAPTKPFDIPVRKLAKVHPDQHIEFLKALYSVPVDYRGRRVWARGDGKLVHIYFDRKLIKTHPRMAPGGRSTDPNDFPIEKRAYAMRDIDYLRTLALSHGISIGRMAQELLDVALPWTRMRRVYRLLGLVRRFGAQRVEEAARLAVSVEMFDVVRLERMLKRGSVELKLAPAPIMQMPLRFGRSSEEWTLKGREEERP